MPIHLAFSHWLTIFISISISLIVLTPSVPAQMDEFLVAHWPFDENSGDKTIDATGNGNDGKINGGKWVEGKFKAALEFNGKDDHVVIPDSKDLDLAQEPTLSAWAKFQELKAGAWKNLVRKEGTYVVEITGQNKLQMSVWAGGNWQNDQAVGGPNLEVGVRYFMVGVKLPDVGLAAYLDGEKNATGNKKVMSI